MAKKTTVTRTIVGKVHDMKAMEPIHKAMHIKMQKEMSPTKKK